VSDSFHLLKPIQSSSEDVDIFFPTPEEGGWPIPDPDEIWAIDLETTGLNAEDPDVRVVGVGISNGTWAVYFDVQNNNSYLSYKKYLKLLADSNQRLIAHNVSFDYSFLLRDGGYKLNWVACTYGLFLHLANEGFPQQGWSLKGAQTSLLGWKETNETDLDNWLIEAGYWVQAGKDKRPVKGEMWRAPKETLGKYCALDAYSCWLLYLKVLYPVVKAYPELETYHERDFLQLVEWLVEQQLSGIEVDREKMQEHYDSLDLIIESNREKFLSHEKIQPFVITYNLDKVKEVRLKEPALLAKPKRKGEDPPISKNWLKWKERLQIAESKNHFNLDSDMQLTKLFYDHLKHEVILKTDSGYPAISERALKAFGEPGALLIDYNEKVKEKSYVEAGLAHSKRDGLIHPHFRTPGTVTGRLSGSGGLNVQQLPKSADYLKTWKARPGTVWVNMDWSSLEQVVLAELSRDPTLLKLYHPDAKPNDVYLFNGAYLPVIGDKIRATGYDPENPTLESIAKAKKECKKERTISKTVTLASSYGAGANKLLQTLKLDGIDVDIKEVYQIHSSYWKLYRGIKDYEAWLVSEWNNNGGWVFNGIGRPLTVWQGVIKDLVNRVCQSTGHDLHVVFCGIVKSLIENRQLPIIPIIADFHDQIILECPTELSEIAVDLLKESVYLLNEECAARSTLIPLKGDVTVVNNLSEAKLD